MGQAVRSTQNFSQQAKMAGSPLQNLNMQVASTSKGLTGFNTLAPVAASATGQLGMQAEKSQKGMNKLSQAFSGNKGMIFGLLGITSAGVEAAGMFSMFQAAQEGVAEAQEKVNKLEEQGMEGTTEYKQALGELAKQTKWVGMVQRNMILSMFDMVFWTGMVTQGLTKQGGVLTRIGGLFTKLKGILRLTKVETLATAAATNVYSASAVAGAGATTALAASADKAKISMAGLGLAVASVAAGLGGAMLLYDFAVKTQAKLDEISNFDASKRTGGINAFLGDPEQMKIQEGQIKEMDEIRKKAGVSSLDMLRDWITGSKIVDEKIAKAGLINPATGKLATNFNTAPVGEQFKTAPGAVDIAAEMTKYKQATELATPIIEKFTGAVLSQHMPIDLATSLIKDHVKVLGEERNWSDMTTAAITDLATSRVQELTGEGKLTEAQKERIKKNEELIEQDRKFAAAHVAQKIAREHETAVLNRQVKAWGGLTQVEGANMNQMKSFQLITKGFIDVMGEREFATRQIADADAIATQAAFDNITAITKQRIAEINFTKILDGSYTSHIALSEATYQGAKAVETFVTETALGVKQNEAYRAGLIEVISGYDDISNITNFTTEQLEALSAAFVEADVTGRDVGKMAAIVADEFNTRLAPAFEDVADIINSKNWKGVKEAFKELELGDMPDKLQKKWRNAFKPLQKAAEHGRQAADAFSLIVTAGSGMSEKNIDKTIKFIANELERVGKVDPEAGSAAIKNIVNSLKDMSVEEIQSHAASFEYLWNALGGVGGLIPSEREAFLKMFAEESRIAGENAETAAPQVDRLGNAIGSLGAQRLEAVDTLTFVATTMNNMAHIKVLPPDPGPFNKGLAAIEKVAADLLLKVATQINKIGNIKVPGVDASPFQTAMDGLVSYAETTVSKINTVFSKLGPGGGGGLQNVANNRGIMYPYAPGDIYGDFYTEKQIDESIELVNKARGRRFLLDKMKKKEKLTQGEKDWLEDLAQGEPQSLGAEGMSATSGKGGRGGGNIPSIQLSNTAALKAIDVVAKRIASLSTIQAMIQMANTIAIKAIDVVAKRIASLETLKPQVSLMNTVAIKVIDVVAKRIDSLEKLKPQISLQNNKAIKAVDVVAKRIDSLEKIKPQINLQNNKAIKAVDVVANRINDLSNIKPSVTVKVKYDTSGKPPGATDTGDTDTAYLISGRRNFTNTDTNDNGNGTMVFNFNISGNEIVEPRKITKFIKKVSGTNIQQML